MSIFDGFGGLGEPGDAGGSFQAGQANSEARRARTDLQQAERRLARLELVCEALWNLLKERTKLTDEDLMSHIAELDLADGQADGRKVKEPQECGQCGRTNSPNRDHCMYCGSTLRTTPF